MKKISRLLSLMIALLTVSGLSAQGLLERDQVALKNWEAPMYWQPSTVESKDAAAKQLLAVIAGEDRASSITPQAQTPPNSLVFVGMTPCRVVDTRTGSGFTDAFGPPSLIGAATRTFPIQSSSNCSIPAIAQAYSFNITLVSFSFVDFITVWPTGQPRPNASTLNGYVNTVIANAAIMPAGTSGSVDVYASQPTNLIIDINGYYAAQSGITLAQGSAGIPSLSFTGDPGTGIFSSGAGDVNIATGGTNRLSVSANGDASLAGSLGIGTASPMQKLHIVTGTADIRLGTTPNGVDGMEIQSSAAGHSPAIYLRHTGAFGRTYRIASYGDNDNASSSSFVIRDENIQSDRLTIDSEGRVRIQNRFSEPGALTFRNAFASSPSSGLTTELTSQLINFGINTGRDGEFNGSFPGYWLRADTRTNERGFHFFKKETSSGSESELMTINDSGMVGIGTNAPVSKLHVSGMGVVRARVDSDSNAGLALTLSNQPKWSVATITGGQFQIFNDATGQNALWIDSASNNVGIGTTSPNDKLEVNGVLRVAALGSAGSTPLCRNLSNQISNCSSSVRYKTNIGALESGFDLITRLRPVTFDWKGTDEHDLGLVAEEVAKVEPRLVIRNANGEIEGVKYDRLNLVLINAIKEQQVQIEDEQKRNAGQQEQLEQQQRQIDGLKLLVCLDHPEAVVCN